MSDGSAEDKSAAVAAEVPSETADGAAVELSVLSASTHGAELTNDAAQDVAETSEEIPIVNNHTTSADSIAMEIHPTGNIATATEVVSVASPSHIAKPSTNLDRPAPASPTAEENDTDFVPPDMEHIVSTGAAQDGASSMQALRELVAQARASSGQPREALPPGFGDGEPQASTSTTTIIQRGEKRKAEDELEQLLHSSAGIDEVKAAAEKSQHPETKTLLQKALSSISGLVSRRGKADPPAPITASTSTDKSGVQDNVKSSLDNEAGAGASDESDSSSDSDSSNSDSSDDDDDDDEDKADAGALLAGGDYDDEDGVGADDSAVPATKNEILAPELEQPAVQQVTEAEKQTLRKLGKVHSIVDSVVVVEQDVLQSKPADGSSANVASVPVPVDSTGRQGERQGEYSVLDTGSLLCFEDGKVLGLVFETFGSIHNPMYSIRFASAASIDRELVAIGKPVFYLPSQSTYVLTQLLRSLKGSDASNMWDEEVAEDEIDYSDDEQEAEAKRRAKALRYGKVDDQGNPLSGPPGRGNKRQKQRGAGQGSQPPSQPSVNAGSQQRAKGSSTAVQPSSQQRPGVNNAPASMPRRPVGGPDLPLPPVPTASASLGPAFPHGIASLPPKPSAGLPSKPKFAADASENHTPEPQEAISSRSRTATADSGAGGLTHSRMNSAAASSLPAKPVDAVAAAAASASTTPKQSAPSRSPYRAPVGAVGASSPSSASRQGLMRAVGPTPAAAYPHQSSQGWYTGAGSASSSTPASPAAPHQPAAASGLTYSPGAGAPIPAQGGGHYNPAHWQQHSYGPAAASAPPAPHSAGAGHAWTGAHQHHPAPLHVAPGTMNQSHAYGAAHGGYGAPAGALAAPWAGSSYAGTHYSGYADRQYHASAANAHAAASAGGQGHHSHGNYAPAAQAYGHGGYATQGASADPYNGYVYTPPSAHAAQASTAAASSSDSYDPRSPSMGGGSGQNQSQGR